MWEIHQSSDEKVINSCKKAVSKRATGTYNLFHYCSVPSKQELKKQAAGLLMLGINLENFPASCIFYRTQYSIALSGSTAQLHFTEIKFFPPFYSLKIYYGHSFKDFTFINSKTIGLKSWPISFSSNVKHRIWLVEYIRCLVFSFDSFNQEKHQ